MSLNIEALSRAATEARGLCMDAVQAANSGHPGMPMGMAPVAYLLFTRYIRHNPKNPKWSPSSRSTLEWRVPRRTLWSRRGSHGEPACSGVMCTFSGHRNVAGTNSRVGALGLSSKQMNCCQGPLSL